MNNKFINSKFESISNIIRDQCYDKLFGSSNIQLNDYQRNLLDSYTNDCLFPIWKPLIINNKKTNLLISNVGEIKDLNGKFLKYSHSKKGYIFTKCVIDNKIILINIHRAVAEAFIPNPENKPEVNHINGNKLCNWYRNLEWNTRYENARHAANTGLILKGESQPISKHSDSQAHEVCKLAEKGYSHKKISEMLNVTDSFVIGIIFRGEWSHISKLYKMPQHKKYADKKIIHNICKELQDGYSAKEISNKLKVSIKLIETIKYGAAHREISNQYNIPGLEKKIVKEKISNKIKSLLDQGIVETNDILKLLGYDIQNKSKRKYINKIKNIYFKDN